MIVNTQIIAPESIFRISFNSGTAFNSTERAHTTLTVRISRVRSTLQLVPIAQDSNRVQDDRKLAKTLTAERLPACAQVSHGSISRYLPIRG
jgi:hypothetical protein